MHDDSPAGETRKLQQVGGGTYTVSIPKAWASRNGLEAGETVHLYPDGEGALVVRPDDAAADADVAESIAIEECDAAVVGDVLDGTLSAAYAAGIERLEVTIEGGLGSDHRRRIESLVRERTGMDVVETDHSGLRVHTMLDDAEVSVPRTLVQLQFVALSQFRTAVDVALDASATDDERFTDRRADARRHCALITRQFARSLARPASAVEMNVDRSTAFDCYRTATALDEIAALSTSLATADGVEAPETTANDTIRSTADGVCRFVEAATTAVVDGATSSTVVDLRATRADVSTLLADVEVAAEADPAIGRFLTAFETAAARGDGIASVAREAALRRSG